MQHDAAKMQRGDKVYAVLTIDTEDVEAVSIECPFCIDDALDYKSDEHENFVYDDYVHTPMLRCCECGAMSILNLPSYFDQNKMVSSNGTPLEEILPLSVTQSTQAKDDGSCDSESVEVVTTKKYKVELFLVTKCVNAELCYFRVKRGDASSLQRNASAPSTQLPPALPQLPPTQEDVRRFIEGGYDNEDKFGIEKIETHLHEFDEDDVDFSLGIECNSYNIEAPAVKYPRFFTMDISGSRVYVEYVNADGKLARTCYWGDE